MKQFVENTVIYPHEILWRSAMTSLDLIQKIEDAREDHLSIQALLNGFLAFEGFINFVGLKLFPDIWVDERRFFSGDDYKGIEGKVAYLFEKFGMHLSKGQEPYQTFKKVKGIRDILAHPKPHQYCKTTEIADSDDRPLLSYKTQWDEFENRDAVSAALNEGIKKLAEQIRRKACEITDEDDRDHLLHPAFEGSLASSEGGVQTHN